jgi:thiamine transport system ATP-binding protein
VLALHDITVRYGDTVAVDGVDLTVEKGSTVCVLGPSGCGKSTLLRVVTGLVRPDAGRVTWDGDDITDVPTHRRGFGLMFQDHALFPHRDVAANVGFGPRMQGRSRAAIAARVDELLELVGLAGYGPRPVDELSGGEQQRVALARALAPEPRMLLLDEPLGSLDRVLRDRLLDELPSLFERLGTTVLYVTHDQDEARAIADQVAVMRAGRLAQVGTPAEVWERPADEFVAEFVRSRRG